MVRRRMVTFEELPELLTVEEAARFLRIGRGLAYALAQRYLASDGAYGLPVLQFGRRLLVPKRQLGRLLDGEIQLEAPTPAVTPSVASRPSRPRTPSSRASSQLALLPPDPRP